MKSIGTVIGGSLLACVAVLAAAGPAAAGGTDAPAASAAPPEGHAWEHRDAEHGGWEHRGRGHHGWGPEGMFRDLGLTEQQRQTMKSIMTTARPGIKSLYEQMQANFKLLRQTSPDDKNYASVLAKISQENGALTTKLISQRAKLYAQFYAQLAPIQKTRLAEIQAMRAKWQEHRKERGQEYGQDHEHSAWHRGPHPGAEGGAAPPPATP
jgi:protein CpxP